VRAVVLLLVLAVSACSGWGSGSAWVQQPLVSEEERQAMNDGRRGGRAPPASRTIGGRPPAASDGDAAETADVTSGGGRVLGTFRNTYYDFPNESDHGGEGVDVMSRTCEPIAKVPRGFYEALCVQGSGSLARGVTVSFAKRDCACAEVCPRTGQRICFEALDRTAFPWGRGAAGTAITPLRTVAADPKVLPIGTVLYIPELDGVPRNGGGATLDGCFIVEDRGLRVQGEHVDIFTGQPSQTAAINAQVPSNRGVTVVVDAPRCAHLGRLR
jgi:3D (Asp-Asp-Asp) domain-containing protein